VSGYGWRTRTASACGRRSAGASFGRPAGAFFGRPVAVTAATALVIAAVLSGCGYTMGGNLPPHITTVAVPMFANQTPRPGIEITVTRAIVEAFSTDGRLRVVTPSEADAVLEGAVIDRQLLSIAFDPKANVQQFRLVLTLNIRFRDVRKNAVLFEQRSMQEQSDFRVQGTVSGTIAEEDTAVNAATAEIARTVVNLAVQRF
jgi:lipopolysaccharide assembly LptE-like protein